MRIAPSKYASVALLVAGALGLVVPAVAGAEVGTASLPRAAAKSVGVYRAFRVAPVVAAAGGYGYGAWLATTRTNGPQRLEILDPKNRRRTVALRHPRDNAVAIVRGADPAGPSTVVAVVSWCKDEQFVEGCERTAYDVGTGKIVTATWLQTIDRTLPPTRERPTTLPATEDGQLVDVREAEPSLEEAARGASSTTCESTFGTVGVQQRTVLPAIPDCSWPQRIQLRDGLAVFTALRPSQTLEYHGMSDVYAIDLRSAAPSWVRIGSWEQHRMGARGVPAATIAGGRVITSTTQTLHTNFSGGRGWTVPELRAWDRAALAAQPVVVPFPIASLPEDTATGALVGLGEDLLVSAEQSRRRKGSKRPLPSVVFRRVTLPT